ncbi:MAG: outer membrane lipoprotein carrier protein LolA [Pseudomonadota bacterium]
MTNSLFGKIAALLILPALVGLGRPGLAGADEWADIRAAAAKTRTVRAEFTQSKHLRILSRPLVSKGRLVFLAPDRIRWEYLEPIRSVMLARPDGSDMFLWTDGGWTADSGQAVEVRRIVLDEIGAWFAGRFEQSGVFSAELDQGPPLKIILTPRAGLRDFVTRIELTSADALGAIKKVEIFEGPDSRTVIDFTRVELNPELVPEIFRQP